MNSENAIFIIIAVGLVIIFLLVGIILKSKTNPNSDSVSTSIQNLSLSIQQNHGQVSELIGKFTKLEPITSVIGQMQMDIRGISDRLVQVEQYQANASKSLNQNLSLVAGGVSSAQIAIKQAESSIKEKVGSAENESNKSLFQISTKLSGELAQIGLDTGNNLTEVNTLARGLKDSVASLHSESIDSIHKSSSKLSSELSKMGLDTGTNLTELNTLAHGLKDSVASLHTESVDSIHKIGSRLSGELSKVGLDTGTNLTQLHTLAHSLKDSIASLHSELSRAKTDLAKLQADTLSRQKTDTQIAKSIHRLETVIAGTQSKGVAGENIVEMVLSKLPGEWLERNFKVNGKPVEFALRLPNGTILPIDSKWAATNLLEQFAASDDLTEQIRLKAAIGDEVRKKAKEVTKYIEPNVTVTFGIAVLPDAVYDLCTHVQGEAFNMKVVLISYSLLIPYLLLVFQTSLKSSQQIDLQKLSSYIQSIEETSQKLQDELEGRFSRAITMLENSRSEMRTQLSKVNSNLMGLHASTPQITELPLLQQ